MGAMADWTDSQQEARAIEEENKVAELVGLKNMSEAQVAERLNALALAGGSPRRAQKRLKSKGVQVTESQLRTLHEEHSGLYMALAADLAQAQEEAIAQQFRELVIGANRVTAGYIDTLAEQMESGEIPKDIERTVTALAKVAQVSTDKLLAITGRPVQGGTIDPMESARKLISEGILRPVDRPAIDTTAEEVA